jgi:hypothetical protein
MTVGNVDGIVVVGPAEGGCDGCNEGRNEGTKVGFIEGLMDGLRVTITEGQGIGRLEGRQD